MPIKLLLEAIVATVALVCFAIAVKALLELVRADRAAKRKAALQADEPTEVRKPIRRAS